MTNWIRTLNRFDLPTPPQWFLVALAEYDNTLVVFASVQEPVYRLAKRVKNTPPQVRVLTNHPDTKVFVDNKLVPVKSILSPNVGMAWGRVLTELPQYDQWRVHRDPNVVADRLDQIEADEEAREQRSLDGELDARAGVGYRLAKYAGGERVGLSYSVKAGAGGSRRGQQPVRRPLGGGPAIFVGR